MKEKVFHQLLAVFVVIIMFGIYGVLLEFICLVLQGLGWDLHNVGSMITGILFGYSMLWLDKMSDKELNK